MKIEKEMMTTEIDYKAIKENAHKIDCSVRISDFDTSHPNPYRLDYITSDMRRYWNYKGVN
jgi:hypothetical protein